MGILSELNRQLHSAPKMPAEITIDEDRILELAMELHGMTFPPGDIFAIERDVQSGRSMIFGLPLRVRRS